MTAPCISSIVEKVGGSEKQVWSLMQERLSTTQWTVFLSVRGWQSFPHTQHGSVNSQTKHKRFRKEGDSHKLRIRNRPLSVNPELRAEEDQEEQPIKSSKAF